MRKVDVLIEFESDNSVHFEQSSAALSCYEERSKVADKLLKSMSGLGLDYDIEVAPTALFDDGDYSGFEIPEVTESAPQGGSWVLPAKIDATKIDDCEQKTGVHQVWPCSKMTYFGRHGCGCGGSGQQTSGVQVASALEGAYPVAMGRDVPDPMGRDVPDPMGRDVIDPMSAMPPQLSAALMAWLNSHVRNPSSSMAAVLDRARTGSSAADCAFTTVATIDQIRALLGVERIWFEGFRGQNVVVGILDEGVNGRVYPVIGGHDSPNGPAPGSASITSHGSMCAADILVAAPQAKLLDYPFLGVPNSGGAIAMFQAVLEQRRQNGTPHLTNNSYGFTGITPDPRHEMNDANHPIHRKVREVIRSGAACFFAAGNCGNPCPSGNCHSSGIGPGNSIQASNALEEVITVAAVNAANVRIGYSAQGPSHAHQNGFDKCKPDVSAYSHFFGNFGTGRPGGTSQPFDNGTSAACPVAAGVGALLLSVDPALTPAELKGALIQSAVDIGRPGYDFETGHGVINAAAAFRLIEWTDRADLVVPPTDC
ncbi:MAG: S8 family serine peptidase [Planctomycetota bacterium]